MHHGDAQEGEPAAGTAILIPLMGPLHLAFPAYNVVSVRDTLAASTPVRILTTALEPGALEDPLWRDTPELALPHAVVPWATALGRTVEPVGIPSPDPAATEDFARYAAGYPLVRQAWQQTMRLEEPLRALLAKPLGLDRIVHEAVPLVRAVQEARQEAFGDGPATDWLARRASAMADTVAEVAKDADGAVAVLAPLDHVPLLHANLVGRLTVAFAQAPPPSDAARKRALLDYAMRGDVADPAEVLRSLRELDDAEARYHEANLLLAHDHPAEALERLEEASRGDFSQPYWLPGYLLTRLGQLYDLAGRRDAAMRAYRGARALSYAPPEARAAAERGLEAPFALEPHGKPAADGGS